MIQGDAAVLMIGDKQVPISASMYAYLKDEAIRRNVTEVDVYLEEMRAAEKVKKLKPRLSRERLRKAAAIGLCEHPGMYGEEEKPF